MIIPYVMNKIYENKTVSYSKFIKLFNKYRELSMENVILILSTRQLRLRMVLWYMATKMQFIIIEPSVKPFFVVVVVVV